MIPAEKAGITPILRHDFATQIDVIRHQNGGEIKNKTNIISYFCYLSEFTM